MIAPVSFPGQAPGPEPHRPTRVPIHARPGRGKNFPRRFGGKARAEVAQDL